MALSRAVFLCTGLIGPDILSAQFPLPLVSEVYFSILKMTAFCLSETLVAQPHARSVSIHKIGSISKYEIASKFFNILLCELKSVIMQRERWSLCFQQNLKSAFIMYFFIVNDTLYFVRRVAAVRENIRPSCPGKISALRLDSEKLVTVYHSTSWHSPEKTVAREFQIVYLYLKYNVPAVRYKTF